jgi:hypothetical protein
VVVNPAKKAFAVIFAFVSFATTPLAALRALPNAVATPVPKPETPVEIGRPVAFVSVPLDGVPRAPPFTTNAPAVPTFVPKAVKTPVPVVVVEGATPAPPPITIAFAANAADVAQVVALLKYGIPPEVPATVNANVPEVVMGEPETLIIPPVNVCETLVTVPPLDVTVAQVPSPRRYVVEEGVPVALIPPTGRPVALVKVPDDGVPKAPPLTTKAPAEPVLTPRAVTTPVPVVIVEGAAPAPPPIIRALTAKAAEEAHVEVDEKYGTPPDVPATVNAKVPDVVTGEPDTLIKPPVNVWPTLVTVPPLDVTVAQDPSPRK